MDKMNSFFGYSVVEKLKFISFDDEQKTHTKNDAHQKNVTINKYQNKLPQYSQEEMRMFQESPVMGFMFQAKA